MSDLPLPLLPLLTKDGRLSAKDFLGGWKVLTQMQTEFAQMVGAAVGLQRGVEGSRATHTTAKQYAAALQKNPTLAAPQPPAPSIADRFTGKAKQLKADHQAALAQHLALGEQARNVAEVSRRARAQQAAALERMRREVDAAKPYQIDAAQLREGNTRLARELQEQRTYFQRQIADLKALLTKTADQVKILLEKVGLIIRQRNEAETEADELRAVLNPSGKSTRPRPNCPHVPSLIAHGGPPPRPFRARARGTGLKPNTSNEPISNSPHDS